MKKVVLLSGVLAAGLAAVPTVANAASPIAPSVNEVNAVNADAESRAAAVAWYIQATEAKLQAIKETEAGASYVNATAENALKLLTHKKNLNVLLAELKAFVNGEGGLLGQSVVNEEFKVVFDFQNANGATILQKLVAIGAVDQEGNAIYSQYFTNFTVGQKPAMDFTPVDVTMQAIVDSPAVTGYTSNTWVELQAKQLEIRNCSVFATLEDDDKATVDAFDEALVPYVNFKNYFEYSNESLEGSLKADGVTAIKGYVGADLDIAAGQTAAKVDEKIYEYVVGHQLDEAYKAVNAALYAKFLTLEFGNEAATQDQKPTVTKLKEVIGGEVEAGQDPYEFGTADDIINRKGAFDKDLCSLETTVDGLVTMVDIYESLYQTATGQKTDLLIQVEAQKAKADQLLADALAHSTDGSDLAEQDYKILLVSVNNLINDAKAAVKSFNTAANDLAVKALNGAIEDLDLAGELQKVEDLVKELTEATEATEETEANTPHHKDSKTHWVTADHNITEVAEVVDAKAAAEAELEAFKAIYNTTTTDNVLNTPLNAVIAWANRNGAPTQNLSVNNTVVNGNNTLDVNVQAVLDAIAAYEQAVMKAELIYDMDDLRAHRDDLVANVKANIGHANLKQLILDCVVAEGEQGFKVDFTNLYRTYQKPVVEQNNKKFGTGTSDLNFETFEAEVVRLHKWLANMQAAVAAETYVLDEQTGEPAVDADGNETVATPAGQIKVLNDKLVQLDKAAATAAEKEGYYNVASIAKNTTMNDSGSTTTDTVTFSENVGKFKILWEAETADYEATCAEIQAAFLTITDEVESIGTEKFAELDGDLDTHLKHTQYLAAWQKANYDALMTLTETINERYDEFNSVKLFVNKYGVDAEKKYWDLLKEGADAELQDEARFVYAQTFFDFICEHFFDAYQSEPAIPGEMYDYIQAAYNDGEAARWKFTDGEDLKGFSEWNKVEEANAKLEEGVTPAANVPTAGYLVEKTKAGITEDSVINTDKYDEEANAGIATAEENLAGNPEGNEPEAGATTPEVKVVYGDLQKAIRALFEKLTENEIANKKLHDDYYAAINEHLQDMYDTCEKYEDVNARDFQQTTALFGFITFTGKYFEEGKCEDERTYLGYKQLQDKLAAFNGDEQAAYNAIESDAFLKGAAPYNTDKVDSADEKKADIDAQIELLWNHIATDQIEAYVKDVEDYYAEKLADAEALDEQCDEEADEEHNHDYHEGAECGWCKPEVAKQLANIRALKAQYAALVAEYHNEKTPVVPGEGNEGNEGNENQGMEQGPIHIGELPNVEEQPTNVPATNLVPGKLQDDPTHSAAGCAKEHVAQFKAFVEVATTAIEKWYEDFVKADEAHKAKLDEAKAIVDKQVHNLDHLAETADFFLQNFTDGDLVAADAWAVEYAQSKVARPDYLDLSGVLEAEHPFEAYVEALREAHLAAVAAAQAAYDKHQYTLLVKIGEEAEGVKAADDFLKEVNANVAAYAGILQHITAVETVLHTIKVDTGCDEGDAEFNETIEDIQAQLDGMRAFVQKHYEGKLEVQPYAEEDGELKSFIESVADYEEALESLEDQIAELKHAIAEETEKVKTSGRWADNLLLKLAEVEMAFDEDFAANKETGDMPLAGAENFKPEVKVLADAIKDLKDAIEAADSHEGILNSTTDRTYVPGGHSVYENRLHFLEDIKALAEDVQSLKDDVAANEAAKEFYNVNLEDLYAYIDETVVYAKGYEAEAFSDELGAQVVALVGYEVSDGMKSPGLKERIQTRVQEAYKNNQLVEHITADGQFDETATGYIQKVYDELATLRNEMAKAQADFHMTALDAALSAADAKFEAYLDDPFTSHLNVAASEELRNLNSAAASLKEEIKDLYDAKELSDALNYVNPNGMQLGIHQQHEAIEADLADLLAKYDRLCAEAHHLSNGKDIYSDQEYFTIGFFRQANDGKNVQGEEMFQHIQITGTPVIKDSYYKEQYDWVVNILGGSETAPSLQRLLVTPKAEVLKTGDKANELGFTIYYEQNETWVGEREVTNDKLLVRSLGVGNADIVFPAYSLLFEQWMWNQHEVTVGVNVVAPKEEATDAAGYALLNKAVFMVEAPIDLTYTINSLVATTDNGAEISFADAKFNTNSRTIEFDLPEGTNYVEFPEGFLTFRGENNTILRSNALTLFVGNTTSIDGLIALGEKVQIFDLQGRRVSAESLIAGQTYVINGTKQIVK